MNITILLRNYSLDDCLVNFKWDFTPENVENIYPVKKNPSNSRLCAVSRDYT